ncbi:MAG: alkaline phosphatase family protein [Terriglobales bacterium]
MDTQTHSAVRPGGSAPSRAAATGSTGLAVYILIDALGWRLAETYGFLPLLRWRRRLRTTLGYSSGAIPTILSGVPPAVHGHWNLLVFDPAGSPFRWMRRLPQPALRSLDNRYGRFALGWAGRHVLRLGPGFECAVRPALLPWFNWGEKRYLYQAGSLAPQTSAFDLWRAARIPHAIYSYRDGDDWSLLRRARRDLERGAVQAQFIYLCQLDHFLHLHRDDPQAIRRELKRYNAAIDDLFTAAEDRDPQVRFRVFSDHGMAPVTRRVDFAGPLRRRGWQSPRDYLAVFDSTMLRFWFFNDATRADIRGWLEEHDCGRVLNEAELRRHGIWFPDGRFGELIFLLDAGCMVGEGEFNGRGWNPHGMHGYHPDDIDSDASLLSNCPADASRSDIQDLFACLCEPLPRGAA